MIGEKSAQMDSDKLPLEAAMDKVGFGFYGFLMTCLTGCMLFSLSCVAYGNPFIVPTSACELQTTTYQQGILASSTIASLLLGGCVWSYLADTRGRRAMLLIALIGGGVFNIIATLSVNWIMLLVCQLTAGLFAAGVYSVSITLISESIPMAYRNTIVLIVCSIMLLSYGCMALLAIPIIPLKFSYYIPALGIYWNSWRTLMLVYCIPNIVSAICLYFMQESPKFVFTMKDEVKALEVLKAIYRINNWRSKEELQIKGLIRDDSMIIAEHRAAKDQIVPLFKYPLLKYTIIMLFMNIAQQLTAFTMWIPTIANQVVRIIQAGENTNLTVCNMLDLDPIPDDPDATPCALDETSLLIVFGVGVLQAMFNLVNSIVINYVGRRNLTMIITSVCGLSGILVNLVPNIFGSGVFFIILIMGIVVPGLCAAICVALFPTNLRVMAIEITMVAQYLGNFASIQILNLLLKVNCAAGYYIFGTLFASIAIAASFLPDDRRYQVVTPAPIKAESSQKKTAIEHRY